METPNTRAGHLTESIMANITRKIGKMPTHNYNAIYGAVLEVLNFEFQEPGTMKPLDMRFLTPEEARRILKSR